jgi:tRNA(Ile2) C34 agmatinyltransferase TiaS
MRIYIGVDDTDDVDADRGTGKVARWFEKELPEGCRLQGVLRQQLLIHESIPYTSHNSSACMVIRAADRSFLEPLITKAIAHVKHHALDGSDPGICVACEGDGSLPRLTAFGHACTRNIVTQKEALEAATHAHLSGHGGTNQGIIGAAAAVGLTASGWSGRFIEYGRLRHFPEWARVSDLHHSNMVVVSVDRDAKIPAPEDLVHTKGWLRPRLWGNRAVVLVTPTGNGIWESLGEKRNKRVEGVFIYPFPKACDTSL